MKKPLLLLLLASLLLSGCWNRREAEQVDYVLAVGIDVNKEGNLSLTIQTPVLEALKPKGASEQEKVKSISVQGKTTFEAIRNYINATGRKLFWGHTQIYVIGEEAARRGVDEYIDFFSADPELRGTSHMAVVKGKAKDVIEAKTQFSAIPANYLFELVSNANVNGKAPDVMFSDFNRMLAEPTGSQPFLPVMELLSQPAYDKEVVGLNTRASKGKEQSPIVYTMGTAVFRGTRLVGYLNEKETRGLLWTKKTLKSSIVSVSCGKDCIVSLEVVGGVKSHKKVVMDGDRAKLHLKVETNVNIGDRSGYLDLSDESKLKELEENFNKVVRSEVEAAFEKSARKFHSDIIAFGNTLDDRNPKLWRQVKSRWEDEILPKAELTVEVNGKVRRTSRTLYSPWVRRNNDQ